MSTLLTTTDAAISNIGAEYLQETEVKNSSLQNTNALFVTVNIGANARSLKMKYSPITAEEIKQTKMLNEILKHGFVKSYTSTK